MPSPRLLMRRAYRKAQRYPIGSPRYWLWVRRGNRVYQQLMQGKLF